MKTYEFDITLTLEANSKEEAKEKARQVMDNLNQMMGYAPFDCDLALKDWTCTRVEYEDE